MEGSLGGVWVVMTRIQVEVGFPKWARRSPDLRNVRLKNWIGLGWRPRISGHQTKT